MMGKLIITLLALLGAMTLLLGTNTFDQEYTFPMTDTTFTWGATILIGVLVLATKKD